MTVSFEKTSDTKGTLSFSIDQETIKTGLDKAFNKVKANISVPGFRKGKISRQMFNKMYGEEALFEEALNAVLPTAYDAAVKEAGIEPVAQPKIDVAKMEKGSDWELTAEVVVKPTVSLGDYKDLTVEVEATKEVSDEEVETRLTNSQNNLAELVVKETAAENGDTVVIDFVGSVDGVEFEGGKGSNHSLELGSGQFIPGFEEQLVGTKAGETVEVKVTFPENYQAEDLAGKEALFVTTVNEVKAKELKAEAYNDAVETAAIEAAVANAEIKEIPEEMIHEEVHRAMNEFLGGMQQQGISPEMYFQITGTSEDDLHKQYEADADKRVRTNLVIEAIAAAENFTTSDEEVKAEIEDLAGQYNMPVEQVEKLLPVDMLKHDIAMKKAVEVIATTAKVK